MDATRLRAFGPGPGPGYDPQAAVPRTAARVERGLIRHLPAHLERLMTSAAAKGEAAPWVMAEADAIAAWAAAKCHEPAEALRLRLHGHQLWALLEPLPEQPSPYRLRLMPHPHGIPSRHPLAPHKGLLGIWNTAPLNGAKSAGAHDALLFWPDGTLVETAIASIALEVDGELWLPPLEGRVASLAERLDLPEWAGPRRIRIQAFDAPQMHHGQLWCFNAVRGVWLGTLL
ncbi:MAG TPA: aminotransferase class IV [Holophagaceae bacterium]|nr:aminotransferase class IV [Holophagaceae bacterium]